MKKAMRINQKRMRAKEKKRATERKRAKKKKERGKSREEVEEVNPKAQEKANCGVFRKRFGEKGISQRGRGHFHAVKEGEKGKS